MSTTPLFLRVPDALKQALAARAREGGQSLTAAAVALGADDAVASSLL